MPGIESVTELRVRYSETDQMGRYDNARVLEWFECGRTDLLRKTGIPYREMEERGLMLQVIEAHVEYTGRARYDDLLRMTTRAEMHGKARLRCEVQIVQAETGADVARGYTIHAVVNAEGKPMRPPEWFLNAIRYSM